ncbi:MAG: hypothetical protein ABI571_01995 [Actinomycetota bacterium]
MDLSELSADLRSEFDAKTEARERALASARGAVRSCGNAIRALHRHEIEGATQLLDAAQGEIDSARASLERHEDIRYTGFIHDAEKELAEARITFALITDGAFPTHLSLGLPPAAFAKGMAESIGEIRRHILDLMRHGELERCEHLLGAMDDMYYVLTSMDYPDGITFGLRRLTDVAGALIERTRGDYTTSVIQSSLQKALTDHAGRLEDG